MGVYQKSKFKFTINVLEDGSKERIKGEELEEAMCWSKDDAPECTAMSKKGDCARWENCAYYKHHADNKCVDASSEMTCMGASKKDCGSAKNCELAIYKTTGNAKSACYAKD